ncbi:MULTISPECIES: hypothetical protein [unclassified Butyricimonas]|uniref:hypothetical protein n=1 Tax=unclassified Butyricimonas TaxID=2637652 RepID=UPI000C07C750|nr:MULTISPECIES: hypothetical protein [unclassified Butyricimonas]
MRAIILLLVSLSIWGLLGMKTNEKEMFIRYVPVKLPTDLLIGFMSVDSIGMMKEIMYKIHYKRIISDKYNITRIKKYDLQFNDSIERQKNGNIRVKKTGHVYLSDKNYRYSQYIFLDSALFGHEYISGCHRDRLRILDSLYLNQDK